jgi:hypothetical protein
MSNNFRPLTKSQILVRGDHLKRGDFLDRGDHLDREDHLHKIKAKSNIRVTPKFAFVIPREVAKELKLEAMEKALMSAMKTIDTLYDKWEGIQSATWDLGKIARAAYSNFDVGVVNREIADKAFNDCARNRSELEHAAREYIKSKVTEKLVYPYCEIIPPKRGAATPKNIISWVSTNIEHVRDIVFSYFTAKDRKEQKKFLLTRVDEKGTSMSDACTELIKSAREKIEDDYKLDSAIDLSNADDIIDDMHDFCDRHDELAGTVPKLTESREKEKWKAVEMWEKRFNDSYEAFI